MKWMKSLRERVEAETHRRPFLRLVQHFALRAAGTSTTSDMDFGLGGALALLAVPGAFSAILLVSKYSSLLQWLRGNLHFNPYNVCLPDEYFFIVYSMAITGLVTLFRWDQLLPDARDFANLAPLSLRMRTIFGANVAALASLAALFAVDINLVSAFLFPLFVTVSTNSVPAFFEFAFAHAMAVVGISVFTFIALLAIQGLLMSILPERVHRRVALMLRTVLLIVFAGTLISVLVIPIPILQVSRNSVGAAHYWPPLWFLSLFESRITALHSRSTLGAAYGFGALAIAAALCFVGFSLSYRRYFLKIAERQNGPVQPSERSGAASRLALSLLRPFAKPGLETATLFFTLKTLFRNEAQILWMGLWVGMGLLLSLQSLKLAADPFRSALVTAPLLFTFFSLNGMRSAFDLPSAASANWIFRLLASGDTHMARSACHKILLVTGLTPLILVWFPISLLRLGPIPVLIAGFFHILVIALSTDLLLLNFRKVPFTCSYTPDRDRLVKAFIIGLVLIVFVIPTLALLEIRALTQPAVFGILAAALIYSLVSLRRSRHTSSEDLLYEDRGLESLALLRLSSD